MVKKTELVPASKGNQSLAVADDFFDQNAGAGLDNVTASDMLVPRLAILQGLSPQLKRNNSAYIEGAKVGDICDVGTGQIFSGPILFLPVYYRKDFLEWAPRESGGGLVHIHSDPSIMDRTTRNEKNQPVLPNGNLISETAQFYGFNLSAGGQMCFVPMASTQLKKARKWVTLAASEKLKRKDGSEYVAPLFYRAYELGTADEGNNKGEWVGWTVNRGPALPEIDFDGKPWASVAQDAANFRLAIMAGDAKGDITDMNSDIADGGGAGHADSDESAM